MRKNKHRYQMIEQTTRTYNADGGDRVQAWCLRFQTPYKAIQNNYEQVAAVVTDELSDIFSEDIKIYSQREEKKFATERIPDGEGGAQFKRNIFKCEFRANYGVNFWEITLWMHAEFQEKLP